MHTDKKTEVYRGAVVSVVALMMKPIAAIVAARATNGPRTLYLSESQQRRMMTKKQSTYGGALRPLDWIRVKEPISAMIVGTNSGSEAKETLLSRSQHVPLLTISRPQDLSQLTTRNT